MSVTSSSPAEGRHQPGGSRTAAQALDALAASQAITARRIRSHSTPWWFHAWPVLTGCARLIVAPVQIVIKVAEGLVAIAVLAVLVLMWAWWSGHITDKDVVATLKPLGQRIISMVQAGNAQP